jgi:hypothetical protein
VSVSGNVVRTVRSGVATVTAKVTYNGASASTQFVVRALSELGGISVRVPASKQRAGKKAKAPAPGFVGIPGFYPDLFNYDVIVPPPLLAPPIKVTKLDRLSRVQVKQAASVPGAASVSVTGPDGMTKTYRVYFARPALSQSFSAPLGSQWSIIRSDPSAASLAGGAFNITLQAGNLDNHTARNVLLQPALGNWTIESRLTLSTPPSTPGQQAGIIAYQGDNDYLKFDWENAGGTPQLALTSEDSLSGAPVSQVLATLPTTGRIGTTVWLRMVKSGARYTAYYSTDGANFAPFYNVGASLTNVKAGVFAFGGGANRAAFANFGVRNTGPVSLASLH